MLHRSAATVRKRSSARVVSVQVQVQVESTLYFTCLSENSTKLLQ